MPRVFERAKLEDMPGVPVVAGLSETRLYSASCLRTYRGAVAGIPASAQNSPALALDSCLVICGSRDLRSR